MSDVGGYSERGKIMAQTAENFANEINSHLPTVKSGTLRFFGVWFGRPYDNIHRITIAEADNEILRIVFDEGEILEISSPMFFEFSPNYFEIRKAQRVLWKWYYYGRPKIDENLYYYDFEVIGNEVRMTTNANWFVEQQVAQISELAVKIY